MNILEIITKKKNKQTLNKEELKYAFNGYLNKEIPDYQMSALLMAITINGMSMKETIDLTNIFIESGEVYNFDDIPNLVDKHSTGGVGDTTTLVIGPMCAALGMNMAKMSGRGLGITGGTIDKLESIPGFNFNLTKEEFKENVKRVGFALSSQTGNLVPMDKVIYALRDVTGSTESIPLIASSIMSKKIASGAKYILIDVKVGSGALIKNMEDAKILSDYLTTIGASYNRVVRTIITDMNTPLGTAIGNALEVREAINILNGKKGHLYDVCIEIVANLLNMSQDINMDDAINKAKGVIENKEALNKFYEFVLNQGGKIDELHISDKIIQIKAENDGIIKNIDALGASMLAAKLGASKMTLDDTIDYSVGVVLEKNIKDPVKKGDVLLTLYINNENILLEKKDFDFIDIV